MPGSCSRNMTLSASASSGGRSASPPTAGSRKAGATVSMSLSRGPRSSSSSTTSSSGKANVERRAVERSDLLIGRPPPNERGRGRGGRGNREVPPAVHQRRGLVGETWFPPRERAEGERRSPPEHLGQILVAAARQADEHELLVQLAGTGQCVRRL